MVDRNDQYEFVQLNRTFRELPKRFRESDEADLTQVYISGNRLSWDKLLTRYRTVILSEAGSGKSEEIRRIATDLRKQGKDAFFLRLEHIPQDLEDAFEVGTFDEFSHWLNTGSEGWLLLDSVDESRLRHPNDFELAIRRLSRHIQSARDRAHIFITGRGSAWRPKTDLALCNQHLPFAIATTIQAAGQDTTTSDDEDNFNSKTLTTKQRDKTGDPSEFTVVALDNLSEEQIRTFSLARGVENTRAFLDAIERADAGSFTSRPQDLEELIEFWREKGRIGSRLELMRNSVEGRLRERNQNLAEVRPLATERALAGVQLVAAATTLSQDPTIQVPDGLENRRGIALNLVLPNWNDKDQAALLSRPIFDQAIYGTVRFHHRSVREYLTAEWLAALLKRPASRRAIESLIFRNQYGIDVVVPTMRPIVPWLAILDQRIRERLRRIAPELMFEGGDPSALPLEIRKQVLAETCEQIASGTSARSEPDYAAVQRFANADLADDIRVLLQRHADNDELRGFLLRMVWLGRLTELLHEAKLAASSLTQSIYTRITAIRAVKAVGTDRDLEDLRNSFLTEAPTLERSCLAELIADTKPSVETVAWLLATLHKAEHKERYGTDTLTDSLVEFVSTAHFDLLPELLRGLNEILDRPPYIERGYCEVSKDHLWLMKAAVKALDRLIRDRRAEALGIDALDILYRFRAARQWGDDIQEIKSEFDTLVPDWPELNRAALWHDVQRTRRVLFNKRGSRLTSHWQTSGFGAFWKFSPDDFGYFITVIETPGDNDDRLVALSLAFEQYVENERPRAWRERLKNAVNDNDELKERLNSLLNPPKSEHTREENTWKRRSAARAKREKQGHEKAKAYILENAESLRAPTLPSPSDISRTQWYLHERLREKNSSSNRWTEGRWRPLVPEYGEAVALAYRDGAVAYWRKYRPQLRSEGAPDNSVPIQIIFGLTGLEIEATETENWCATLKPEEVLLACRYAAHELNGFPSWFPQLFQAHPQAVSAFLLQEIGYELSVESPDSDTNYLLSDVSYSGDWAWNDLAPAIIRLLDERNITNAHNLTKLLTILNGASVIHDDDIAEITERKACATAPNEHRAIWFAVWVGVQPELAIPAIDVHLRALHSDDEQKTFAMVLASRLMGGRASQAIHVRSAFRQPKHLKDLYLLMHTYIRRSEDLNRANGPAYSPGLRDNAQDARDALFEQLNRISGKEAYVAIDQISKAHPEEAARPWFISHARSKAEQDAEMQPWSAQQVREFHERLDRTPANHRDLADLAVLRLLDLQDDIENGDSSIARVLRPIQEETVMRNYIAHELRDKAFGRYSVTQEEEFADAKRPDLRFLGVGFDAPVPTELKLADKWSGPQLFERLENQLCGDYLRDSRSTRGIFVLVYRGEKQSWDIPGSANRVDFEGLIPALQHHWAMIADRHLDIENVTVVGIDLTKRFI